RQRLPEEDQRANAKEQQVYPPEADLGRNPAFFHLATHGNQQAEVTHVQEQRRQQLEIAALARVGLGHRHGEQRHDQHDERQRQPPLQLRLLSSTLVPPQAGGGVVIQTPVGRKTAFRAG